MLSNSIDKISWYISHSIQFTSVLNSNEKEKKSYNLFINVHWYRWLIWCLSFTFYWFFLLESKLLHTNQQQQKFLNLNQFWIVKNRKLLHRYIFIHKLIGTRFNTIDKIKPKKEHTNWNVFHWFSLSDGIQNHNKLIIDVSFDLTKCFEFKIQTFCLMHLRESGRWGGGGLDRQKDEPKSKWAFQLMKRNTT